MKIIAIIASVLLIVCTGLLLQQNAVNNNLTKIITQFDNTVQEKNEHINHLNHFFLTSVESNNWKIHDSIKIVSTDYDTVQFTKVLDDNFLIFKYSYTDCSSCINEMMQMLWEMKDSMNVKVLIVAHYPTVRELIVQNTTSFRNLFPIYLIESDHLGLPVDNLQMPMPYLLSVDKNGNIHNMLCIDMEYKKLIREYVTIVTKYE
jgi:hypothetical protein